MVMPDPLPGIYVDLPTDPPADSRGLLFQYRRGKVTPLWTLDGLEPNALKVDDIRTGLELYGPTGRIVRRLIEKGRAYLNDRTGRRGRLAIQVVHMGVPPHPGPRANADDA